MSIRQTSSFKVGMVFLIGVLSGYPLLNANVLQNPGFEDGMDHWEITTGNAVIITDTLGPFNPSGVRNGHNSLNTLDIGVVGFRQIEVPVEPYTWYRLTVYSKIKDLFDAASSIFRFNNWSKFYIDGEEVYHVWHNWNSGSWLQQDWTIFNTGVRTSIEIEIERYVYCFPPFTQGLVYDDIILAPYDTIRPLMLSAEASDGDIELPGIDNDDYVTIAFSEPTNKIPIQRLFEKAFCNIVHPIDIVFKLLNGNAWLDGDGNIKKAVWNANGDTVIVYLITDGGVPSIQVGDTIRPGRCKILDESGNPILRDVVVLTGSFGGPGIEENATSKPFRLFQNMPNPFEEKTTIRFQIPEDKTQDVSLGIYDVTGRMIRHWDYQTIRQSNHVIWNGKDDLERKSPSGIYFYRLQTGDELTIKKMVLLRR